jgi:2-polyprenyl-3-methyl-5-hydroxy-6-metoxy-1,4-benzoquinol methylase
MQSAPAMSSAGEFWDARFSATDYVYGEAPNDFLASVIDRLPRGRALSLGDGEGRNGVALARAGFTVTTVDASSAGVAKARALAEKSGVTIEALHADLNDHSIAEGAWEVIVSVFCHLPAPLRQKVHRQVVRGLAPGGAFVLEAYTPAQLAYSTGGPKDRAMLYTLDDLRDDLAGLEIVHGVEIERDVREGTFHTGHAAVVQVLARRP